MKRVAALAVVSLVFLGACSSNDDTDTSANNSSDTASNSNSNTKTDEREYTMADGSKVTFDRLAPLPENMMADVQARFDAVLFEPDVDAYTAAAATDAGPDETVDTVLAFKGLATTLGSETGKYYGGVIRMVTDCDGTPTTTWGFIGQDQTTPTPSACDSADPKADASAAADSYIVNALGGPDAWVIVTQNSDK